MALSNGDSFTGALFASTFSLAADGENANSRWVTINDATPVSSVTFSSGAPAFEFDLATAPEPSTWAMMVLGFVALGYAAFRRNAKSKAALAV